MRASLVIALVTLALFEGVCFLGERYSLAYLPAKFRLDYFAKLRVDDGTLGWAAYGDEPRAVPGPRRPACALAFGDSFTHASEVADDETWSYQLSNLLGCGVDNYGVGGYGQDQALLRYERIRKVKGREEFVIVAVYQEMLRRNLAASWLTYANLLETPLKPYFFYDGDRLELARPGDAARTARGYKDYHAHDWYFDAWRFEFPFSVSLARMAWARLVEHRAADAVAEDRAAVFHNPYAAHLELDILRRMHAASGGRLAWLLMPHAGEVVKDGRPYGEFAARLAREFPGSCILDPFDALHEFHARTGDRLHAPQGHFNAAANRVIAEYLAGALPACAGFAPVAADGQPPGTG